MKKNIRIFIIMLLVFFSIGVVYGALTTNFNVSGNINVKRPTYLITFSGSNLTYSSLTSSIDYDSSTTNKITPSTGYYLKSFTCTNGYTTNATTGTSATATQTVTINNNKNVGDSICTANMSNVYNASMSGNNTSFSTTNLEVEYGGISTIEVTPKTGYYFTTASCTNGYTVEGLTSGKGNTSKQTLTIKNNTNAKDSVCTISAIDAYSISFTGSNATYAAPQGGTIGYGGTRIITLTPSTGYWLSNISCTNGYTATGNMGPNKPGSSAQDITVNNNNNAADTKCTVTMSNSYSIYMFGENVTFSKQALSVVYKGSTSVTITPSTGYYLKSFTCEDGITHNAATGTSATGSQTITLTNNVLSTASCTAVASEIVYEIGQTWTFDYTGNIQTFKTPCEGTYKLEVWGAQGGNATAGGTDGAGGTGGYSYGNINLAKTDTLYIGVGGQGGNTHLGTEIVSISGGYNGGGAGRKGINTTEGYYGSGSGGGATHIALNQNRGVLANYDNYRSEVLIVAGGGGGAKIIGLWNEDDGYYHSYSAGKAGGGLSGLGSKAGTQTTGYAFGQAGKAGGGGWYGAKDNDVGAGGSGYIDGVIDGTTIDSVRSGNGYAQITLISKNQ